MGMYVCVVLVCPRIGEGVCLCWRKRVSKRCSAAVPCLWSPRHPAALLPRCHTAPLPCHRALPLHTSPMLTKHRLDGHDVHRQRHAQRPSLDGERRAEAVTLRVGCVHVFVCLSPGF